MDCPDTPNLPAVRAETTSLMEVISRAAHDPAVDIEKMERLLAMQERILARNAQQEFNEAMRAAQEAMPRIVRDAENKETHSKYARLETIAKAITPVITGNGFSLSFGTADCPTAGHYRVTCDVSHIGGHTKNYQADVPADISGPKGNRNKSDTHAFGSTMSYGRRYLTLLIFNISMKGEDDDGNGACGGGPITAKQVEEIQKALDDNNKSAESLCKWLKVQSVPEMTFAQYAKALDVLTPKGARK